jgi:hypothetical protein
VTIDKEEYKKRMRLVDRAFILLTILFFAILISFMVILMNVRHLSHRAVINSAENATLLKENNDRIQQEKLNQVASCKHTYSGIKDVFEIFFPKHPSSAMQARDLKKFNDRIDELKSACNKPRNS